MKFCFLFASEILLKKDMFKDKIVVVTGASDGIGRSIALEFARQGAGIVLAARNEEKLKSVFREAQDTGADCLVVPTDVSNEEHCKNLIDRTIDHFGKIDILVCNAGISMRSLFIQTEISVLKRLMDVNFWGMVYCVKYALPYLLISGGSVVGVNSVAGYVGLPGRTGYSASKFAMRGFLDTLRCETRKTGLHVLNVAPGFTASNIRTSALLGNGTEQGGSPRNEGKMMSPETVAVKVIAAITKRNRELILTFTEGKLTVFLNKFFPGFIEKLAYNHMDKEPDSPFS